MKSISKRRIGIIGIGAMGSEVAYNLLKKKYIVYANDINPNKKSKFKKFKSFYSFNNIDNVFLKVNKVLIFVENHKQSQKILNSIIKLSNKKLLQKNFTAICCSTVPPEWIIRMEKKLSRKKINLVDCPMSGGPAKARKGELSLMISAKVKTYLLVKKLLKDISKNQFFMGIKVGYGSQMKMINQSLAGTHILAAAEAIALAKREGLNLKKVYNVISKSAGNSWMFGDRAPRMISKAFLPHKSKISIFIKDMSIVNNITKKHGLHFPLSKASLKLYKKAEKKNMQNFDDSSTVLLLDKKF